LVLVQCDYEYELNSWPDTYTHKSVVLLVRSNVPEEHLHPIFLVHLLGTVGNTGVGALGRGLHTGFDYIKAVDGWEPLDGARGASGQELRNHRVGQVLQVT